MTVPRNTSSLSGGSQRKERRFAVEAFAVGMTFDLASLYIANPYVITFLALTLAGFAVVRWQRRPLPWIALASAVAANPVNLSVTIACNVLMAGALLLVAMRRVRRMPGWLIAASALALLSVLGSVFFWGRGVTPETAFTQGGSVANYVLGPFFLLPFVYEGAAEGEDGKYLAKALLVWLIAPTVVLLTVTRAFGTPVDSLVTPYGLEMAAVYRLWNVGVTLTRTQVGIVLAALGSASFALVVAGTEGRWRWISAVFLTSTVTLMLLTGSVGSALALVAGIAAVLTAAARRVKVGQYIVIGAIGAGVVAGGMRLMPGAVFEYVGVRYEERFAEGVGAGAADRTVLWARAAEYAMDNPMGVGWSLLLESLGIYPHNDYLSYAIAYGVLCGVLYAYVIGRLWITIALRQRSSRGDHRFAIRLAGLGAATVLLVNSMSDHLSANRWYFNVVWSVVWFCAFASGSAGRRALEADAG